MRLSGGLGAATVAVAPDRSAWLRRVAQVLFRPDDESLSALLRSVQPALELDEAGLLTLSSHGSTASAVLAAAEALLLTASTDGAILVGDDFGDGLDAATAEHLAGGHAVLTLGFGG